MPSFLLSSGDFLSLIVGCICIPLRFPFGKFPLPFLALVKSENVREDAARDLLDLMLGDAGVVDELFASTQDSPPSYANG